MLLREIREEQLPVIRRLKAAHHADPGEHHRGVIVENNRYIAPSPDRNRALSPDFLEAP